MLKTAKTNSLYIFIILFFVFSTVAYLVTTQNKEEDIAELVKNKEEILVTNLKVIEQSHQEIAQLIYDAQINRPEIINIFENAHNKPEITRQMLFITLNPLYNDFKLIGLRQFHFHLPNGDSFLRLHKPSRFGDNLLNARESVAYVAKHHKPISGFEEGKVFSGFRFVYPLFSGKKYIGSVEISFSKDVFIEKFSNLFPLEYIFILKKAVSDKKLFKSEKGKYITSSISKNYSIEKNGINKKIQDTFEKNNLEDLDKKLSYGENFSIIIEDKIATFISIKNSVTKRSVGFIIGLEENTTIDKKLKHYYIILFSLIFAILATLIFIYREIKHSRVAEQKKEETNKILLNINNNLKSKVKEEVESNLANAKFTAIGKLAAGMTHEINTPLTYIKANFEMMGYDIEDLPKSEIKTRMQEDSVSINDGIKRLSNIVESMREMSQKSSEAREDTNLYASLITALTMAHNRAKQVTEIYIQGNLFEIGMNKNEYSFISNIQKQRVEQVFIIILNNALDELVKIEPYEKRKITITLESDNNKQIIRFKDNAGGINKSIMPKLFEAFESTKESSGMGVGLSIAKKIIEEQNGEITAYNEDDGAVFEIII